MQITPTEDRIIVRPTETTDRTASGLILPPDAQEKPQVGEVLFVGPGRITPDGDTVPMTIKPGDSVLYNRFSGMAVDLEGESFLVLIARDIVAVLP